jgi:hypothetical protein
MAWDHYRGCATLRESRGVCIKWYGLLQVRKSTNRQRRQRRKMATEGHRHGQGKDRQQKSKAEMDKELEEIRAELNRLELKMQQEAKVHWTYEWPLKRKAKWHVQKFLARRQQQVMRKWLRHVENLSDTKEEQCLHL